jgi:hypothetical protein
MLYHLAWRADDFEGEEDLGSSLRGLRAGLSRRGLEEDWPDDIEWDLDNSI